MTPTLWISTIARPAHPSCGGDEVFPARIAIALADVRARLEDSRARMERHREPPAEIKTINPMLDFKYNRHKTFLTWSALIAKVEQAIELGEDIESDEFKPLVKRWCGYLIVNKLFAEAFCSACARSYSAGQCEALQWSAVSDPRAGVGGLRLRCPAGHTLFVHVTWVA